MTSVAGRHRRAVVRLLAAAVVTGAALTGCAVRPQDHPDVVADGPLTSALRGSATPVPPSTRAASVYFLLDGRLVAVDRQLPVGDALAGALQALVAGPGSQDADGLDTALPSGSSPWRVTLADGVATIDVPADFARLGARNEVLAVGQLVFTAMAQPGVAGVRLASGGVPIEVPVDSGQLVERPVTRADYPSLAPQ